MAKSSDDGVLRRGKQLAKDLWIAHTDGIVKVLPALGAILGAVAVLASMFAPVPDRIGSGLEALGAAILGGGIFALMMKYLVIMGSVKRELRELFESPDFRHQLVDFHIGATGRDETFAPYPMRRYLELNFPELVPCHDASVAYYAGGYFGHYFSRITRRITIRSIDADGFLTLDDAHVFVDKPLRAQDRIDFGFRLSKSDVPLGKSGTDLYCEVDTIDCSEALEWDSDGAVSFTTSLQGQSEYVIKRRLTRTWSVLGALHMTLQRMSTNLTVEVRNEIPDIVDIHLEFLNIFEFPKDPKRRRVNGAVEIEYILPSLMLPQQGYILTFRALQKMGVQGIRANPDSSVA